MTKLKRTQKEASKIKMSPFKEYWGNLNFLLLYIGLGIILFGYYLMGQGTWDNSISLTVSPIVLLFSYIVIIPLSIFIKIYQKQKNKSKSNVSS